MSGVDNYSINTKSIIDIAQKQICDQLKKKFQEKAPEITNKILANFQSIDIETILANFKEKLSKELNSSVPDIKQMFSKTTKDLLTKIAVEANKTHRGTPLLENNTQQGQFSNHGGYSWAANKHRSQKSRYKKNNTSDVLRLRPPASGSEQSIDLKKTLNESSEKQTSYASRPARSASKSNLYKTRSNHKSKKSNKKTRRYR